MVGPGSMVVKNRLVAVVPGMSRERVVRNKYKVNKRGRVGLLKNLHFDKE